MPAVELATGYISLVAETSSISKSIGTMFKGADKTAATAGRSMGQALKKNFEGANSVDMDGLRKNVEEAQSKITASTERNAAAQAKATRAVQIAEAELEDKRASGRMTKAQEMKAEDKIAAAKQRSAAASLQAKADLEKYTKELDESKKALSEAESAATKAADGTKSAWSGVGAAIKKGMGGDFSGAFDGVAKRADFVSGRVKEEFGVTSEAVGAALDGDFKGAFQTLAEQGSSAAKRLKGDLKTAFTGVRAEAATAADGVEQEFTQAGDEAAGGFSDKMIGGLKGIGGLAAAAGIGVSLAEGITGGMEREKLGGKLAAQLNLAGPDAARAGDVAGSLFAGAWGESLDETHDAVSAVMSSIPGMMDAPAASLEGITAKALDMATAFDLDVNESVGAVGVLLRNGLAKDATAAFDLMVGGMQRVPAGFRDELLPAITEYSQYFGDLGISGEQAMNMLIRGAENGTIGVDKMGDAVKEFQIRSTDMSKATGDAYDTIGLDMQTMTNEILAGGDSAQGALGKIINGLTEIEDPASRAEAAIALFGTPLEDLSVNEIPAFLGMLDPAGDKLDDFAGSSANLGETLNNNTATAFESLKRSISSGFVDAIGGAAIGMTTLWSAVEPFARQLAPFAAGIGIVAGAYGAWTLATWAVTAAQTALGTATVVANLHIAAIVAGIGLLVGGVIWAYKNIDWFRAAVNTAWSFIRTLTAALVSWFVGTAFPAIVNAVRVVGNVFSWLNTNIIQPVWNGIRSAISAVAGWFTGTIVPNFNKSVTALGQFFDFLYRNFIAPFVWAFRMAIGAVRTWFANTIVPAFRSALDILGARFRWLNDKVIQPVWTWIQDKIGAFLGWFNTKRLELQDRLRVLGEKFRALYNAYVKPAFDWIRDKASAVWGVLRDRVFTPMRDGLTRLSDAFTKAKDGIGKTWDKLKAKVKEPISFVVTKVINPFISGYNDLNNFWSGSDLSPIKGFARGGWTGPGSKYQEAGIVHADEFVIRKESQRDLSRSAPGLLDGLNKYGSKALGYANGGVVSPLKGKYPLTQGYNRVHKGIDIGAPSGTPLYATANGRVTHAGPGARAAGVWGGNEIHVASGGLERWFAHLSQIMVRQGQMVKAGQMIGRTGNTGISSGPHLHMGVFRGGWPNDINPLSYLGGAIKFDQNAPGGGGGIDPLGWIREKLDKHITGPMRNAKERFASNKFAQMPLGIASKAFDSIKSKAAELASPFLNGVDEAVKGVTKAVAGVGDRLKASKWMAQALRHTGDWSLGNQNAGVRRMDQESGFNPNAVNNWDSNAKAGTPSKGLMQVIGPTFSQYRDRSLPNNILDPIANIVASINYTKSRYGSLTSGWNRAGGYADGGLVQPGNVWDDPVGTVHRLPQGVSSIYNGTGGAEYFQRVDPSGGSSGPKYHIENFNALDTDDALRKLRRHELRREALAYVA